MKRPPHPQGLVRYTRWLDIKFKNGKHIKVERKVLHFPKGAKLPEFPPSLADFIRCCYTNGDTAEFKWVYKKHS